MRVGNGRHGPAAPPVPVACNRAYAAKSPDGADSADLRRADIETLARIAARIAGKDPDALVTIKFGEVVAFDDLAWRYPDFLARAAAAYRLLEADQLIE